MAKFQFTNPKGLKDFQDLERYLVDLNNTIRLNLGNVPNLPVNKDGYILNVGTLRREVNPSTATTQEVAEFLNTLVKDLADAGIVSAKER